MATRDNTNKLRWSLIPIDAMEELLTVAEYGAKKYGKYNWQQPPYLTFDDILDSLYRHVAARRMGVMFDGESMKFHMAHAMWNCMALLTYDLRGYWEEHVYKLPESPDVDDPLVLPEVKQCLNMLV